MTHSRQEVETLLNGIQYFAAHRFSHQEVVDSTNNRLKELLNEPNFVPRVLLADFQTSGRGQFERQWFGHKKSCLMFSFSGAEPLLDFPLSLRAGIAAYMGIIRVGVSEHNLWLKWPNDIWSGRRKLGGILSESNYAGQCLRYVIGMGINLRPQKFDCFNNEVADISTLGVEVSAIELMLAILACWNELENLSAAQLCQKWSDCAVGFWQNTFKLETSTEGCVSVVPLRLCHDGSLIVKADKKEISLHSGRLIPVFD